MQVVVQVMEDEMGQLSPVLLQWWEVVFIEWEHTLQSPLLPHFLNPRVACLLALACCCVGTLALTRMSLRELVLE